MGTKAGLHCYRFGCFRREPIDGEWGFNVGSYLLVIEDGLADVLVHLVVLILLGLVFVEIDAILHVTASTNTLAAVVEGSAISEGTAVTFS